jgi:hypothetical protein
MTDPNIYITMATASLAGLAMITTAGLSGWRSWLALKHSELDRGQPTDAPVPNAGARIEIADLKERIKKLEAIAAGVDL